MIAFFRRHPLMLSLAVLAAVLVVVIGMELGFGTRLSSALNPSAPKRAAATEVKLLPPLLATAPEQAYPETAARPLFTPTRRPAPPPDAAAVAQPAFKHGQFVLQGVTIVGDNRIVLLREKSTGRIHRVELGREVNGIKVAEIKPEAVTLAQGGETEVLTLDVQKVGAAPAAAAPAAAVPLGPFAAPASAPQHAPASGAAPSAQPVTSMPIPARIPGAQSTTSGDPIPAPGAPVANPAQPSVPQATTNPMSPEELLARRRARRTQQNQ